MPVVLKYLAVVVLSYLLGSFNFAIIVSKYIKHDDIRIHGSGNAGITNYARTFGGKSTLLVMVGDMGKCVLAILAARFLLGDLAKFLAGLCVMLGHAFPLYFGFRGGKGVLTTCAMIITFDLRASAIGLTIFAVILILTRYVSLASLIAVWSVLPMVWVYYQNSPNAHWCIVIYAIIAVLITFLHRSNISRLIHGTESKFRFKRKKRGDSNLQNQNGDISNE